MPVIIDNQTRVLGLIGEKLSHSLSPVMQNYALDLLGEDYVYLPFEIPAPALPAALEGIKALGISGINVTIPYKQAVIEFLDELDDSARKCGAVNVIHNREGRLCGFNTDGAGFILGLQDSGYGIPAGVLLIGGGGAARSVAVELASRGSREFFIMEREPRNAESLGQILKQEYGAAVEIVPSTQAEFNLHAGNVQLVINCSPAGMHPHVENAPVEDLAVVAAGTLICDLIYNPLETRFIKMARGCGLPAMNGVAMLANQGALSLEIWTGREAPRQAMQRILEETLGAGEARL